MDGCFGWLPFDCFTLLRCCPFLHFLQYCCGKGGRVVPKGLPTDSFIAFFRLPYLISPRCGLFLFFFSIFISYFNFLCLHIDLFDITPLLFLFLFYIFSCSYIFLTLPYLISSGWLFLFLFFYLIFSFLFHFLIFISSDCPIQYHPAGYSLSYFFFILFSYILFLISSYLISLRYFLSKVKILLFVC